MEPHRRPDRNKLATGWAALCCCYPWSIGGACRPQQRSSRRQDSTYQASRSTRQLQAGGNWAGHQVIAGGAAEGIGKKGGKDVAEAPS
ncbi:hypothetical protein GQ55_7G252200 [Panicum hallii var. hallii]|uniref:Uncharacterized protein n=1 Tax=Panicum hallii var. hallii TaxID=1504633 RepID=A0A2T7CZ55_9POAL|nr:hypothetical protein GQ55_7G252200 [Panicum hallii var. hallii]